MFDARPQPVVGADLLEGIVRKNRRALRIALALLAGGLVACGSAGASALPLAASPAAAPSGLTAAETVLDDPRGDPVHPEGHTAPPSPIVDVLSVAAAADGQHLTLRFRVAGTVPGNLPSFGKHEITYATNIEKDGSGLTDYTIVVANRESGAWYATLIDYSIGRAYAAPRFPGSLAIVRDAVIVTISLAALGMPTQLRFGVVSQRADHTRGTVLAEDQVPPRASTDKPGDTWLTLK